MIDTENLLNILKANKAQQWANILPSQLNAALHPNRHKMLPTWQQLIINLPDFTTDHRILTTDTVQIGYADDISNEARVLLKAQLQTLQPWRKGPFDLFGIRIDTEWRSDFKWRRLEHHISPLTNRLVLDVGCGSGYFCWRMLGSGAQAVIGIDPLLLNVIQFLTIRKLYSGTPPVFVLPLGIEDLPANLKLFDTVFSMGVLYHRRSPIDHLLELKNCLAPGGELILETLIIDGGLGQVLMPEDRYAGMHNVWFLPSCLTVISWLKRCGFNNIRLIDITPTSTDEQRSTDWMPFQSLQDHLHADNPALTCEGLPAPKRAIFLAQIARRK